MTQKFIQGQINQAVWVAVDKTDFATPESALSATTKIRIYGVLRDNSTVPFFVSSGTGSLAAAGRDIQHIGPSAFGTYGVALGSGQLSDASAAFYDKYILQISDTGGSMARQVLTFEGERTDTSFISAILSDIYSRLSDFQSDFQSRVPKEVAARSQLSDLHSDIRSYLVVMSGIQSDIYSALSDFQSDFQSRVPKRVATDSQLSDLHSDLRSYLVGVSAHLSNVESQLSDYHSNIISNLTNITLSASSVSDVASAVIAGLTTVDAASLVSDIESALASRMSDILSAAQQVNSRVLVNQSRVSDIQSFLSDFQSDLLSHVDTTGVGLNASTMSDIRSAINALTVSLDASNISDIASAVVAALPITSAVSDIYSLLSDLNSNFHSRIPKEPAARSQLSDLASDMVSDLRSFIGAGVPVSASSISDIASATVAAFNTTDGASLISDIVSAMRVNLASDLSDTLSAAQQINSRVLVVQSRVSDIQSALSDAHSDLASKIGAITVSLDASNISDIASAVVAALPISSQVSDIYSLLSDLNSNFHSRIPKEPAARSQLSDLSSDTLSYLTGMSGMLSDVHSGLAVANSRVLLNQSSISDVYSLLSDLHSDVAVASGVISDIYSNLAAGVTVGGSSISDIQSAVWGYTLTAPAGVIGATPTTGAAAAWLATMSRNKLTQTATKGILYADNGTTVVASSVDSDDGTTTTRGKFG